MPLAMTLAGAEAGIQERCNTPCIALDVKSSYGEWHSVSSVGARFKALVLFTCPSIQIH